jgi:hypothetical protein
MIEKNTRHRERWLIIKITLNYITVNVLRSFVGAGKISRWEQCDFGWRATRSFSAEEHPHWWTKLDDV